MEHTLHKLPEGFIISSDEQPKGSDLIMWTGNTVEHFPKQGTPNINYGCVVDVAFKMFGEYRPFSLEEIISIMDNKQIEFVDHHNKHTNVK
jgi:hypothetical protein